MRSLTTMLDLLRGLTGKGAVGLNFDAVGAMTAWRETGGIVHLGAGCGPGDAASLTSAQIAAAKAQDLLCATCDDPAFTGPWPTLVRRVDRLHRLTSALRHPRSNTGGYPDYGLSEWVQASVLASTLAAARVAAADLERESYPAEVSRWLQACVDYGQEQLDRRQSTLAAQQDVERVCWRYVDGTFPRGDASAAVANSARSTWRAALKRGLRPSNAASSVAFAKGSRFGLADGRGDGRGEESERVTVENLIEAWTAIAKSIIDDSLAAPWHDVAILEPHLAREVTYTREGTPFRASERRTFALGYFPGQAVDDIVILRVPSVVAAGLRSDPLVSDLGPGPAFPTPEHLVTARRLRAGGGANTEWATAVSTARLLIEASADWPRVSRPTAAAA